MTAGGYVICSPSLNPNPPVEDSSRLPVLTGAAGISFAASLTLTAAENLFRLPENRSRFHSAMAPAVSRALMEHCPDISPELLNQFIRLGHGYHLRQMLNPDHPGTGDLLGVHLSEISRMYQDGSVAFMEGFFYWEAINLMAETVSAVEREANKSHW